MSRGVPTWSFRSSMSRLLVRLSFSFATATSKPAHRTAIWCRMCGTALHAGITKRDVVSNRKCAIEKAQTDSGTLCVCACFALRVEAHPTKAGRTCVDEYDASQLVCKILQVSCISRLSALSPAESSHRLEGHACCCTHRSIQASHLCRVRSFNLAEVRFSQPVQRHTSKRVAAWRATGVRKRAQLLTARRTARIAVLPARRAAAALCWHARRVARALRHSGV